MAGSSLRGVDNLFMGREVFQQPAKATAMRKKAVKMNTPKQRK